jgi:uncharacterized membrane protein YqjE
MVMLSVRRWYIYLVSAISLQSVTWASIFLLRFLLVPEQDPSTLQQAFFISVIIIGLPIFLAHWIWAQRLAKRELEEQGATLRRVYLYGMMAGFIIPMIANIDGFIEAFFRVFIKVVPPSWYPDLLSPGNDLLNAGIAIVILGIMWFYHNRIRANDAGQFPEVGELATVRRLYVYTFVAGGLIITISACMNLLLWTMYKIWGELGDSGPGSDLFILAEIARLLVGVPLWLYFWSWAQRLFHGEMEEERASALRKLFLYMTVFLSAVYGMFTLAMVISDGFRLIMDIPSLSEPSQIRGPIASILVMAAVWAFHTHVLRQDMVAAGEGPRQAQIRRLYYYLMAAIGLAAFLVGLAGNISVLIDRLSEGEFTLKQKDLAAWFTAAVIVGLPVWIIPWRRSQRIALLDDSTGEGERQSIVRKIYLYLFLFAAAMTALGSAIYTVAQIVDLALGGREAAGLLGDLALSIALVLIAVSVWLYHIYTLRADGRMAAAEESKRLGSLRVTILDGGDGRFGRSLLDELGKELPDLTVHPIGLSQEAAEVMGGSPDDSDLPVTLAESDVIVGPWDIVAAGAGDNVSGIDIPAIISNSSAKKLIIPTWRDQIMWAGVDRWDDEEMIHQAVHAVRQIATGEELKPSRPLNHRDL